MLGLIFIIVTYAVVVGVCFLVKYIKDKIGAKSVTESATSKIYYVTNSHPKKRATTRKKPDIAIKGSIIEKIESE